MIGKLDDIMIMTSPCVFHKYVTVNNIGEIVLYLRDFNIIYGIMKS